MKSDHQLKQDVTTELAYEPSVNESHIGVSAQNGIVTLSGHVPTYGEKYGAEKAVKRACRCPCGQRCVAWSASSIADSVDESAMSSDLGVRAEGLEPSTSGLRVPLPPVCKFSTLKVKGGTVK